MTTQDTTPKAADGPADNGGKTGNANPNRLLVLDDSREFITLVTRFAQRKGYQVQGVTTTKDFIALFVDFNPSVVILDLFLETNMSVGVIEFLGARRFAGLIILVSGFDFRYLSSFAGMVKQMNLKLLGTVQKGGHEDEISNFLERARLASQGAS